MAESLSEEFVRLFYEEQYNGVVLGDSNMITKIEKSIYAIAENNINSIKERVLKLYNLTRPDCMITILEQYRDLEVLRKYDLNEVNMTEAEYIEELRKKVITDKVNDTIRTVDVEVSEEEVVQHYEANKAEYMQCAGLICSIL
ncbi:hypothetical protein [Cellulosilyticum ruminicola]|uniref:hypothetical protein n=1 Tax=Cellulosilyticum ruminicola TaxID=425254 RepID=UPI0006D001D7|nr:hypothetical protein [Cellulosilyticum ruminicola]